MKAKTKILSGLLGISLALGQASTATTFAAIRPGEEQIATEQNERVHLPEIPRQNVMTPQELETYLDRAGEEIHQLPRDTDLSEYHRNLVDWVGNRTDLRIQPTTEEVCNAMHAADRFRLITGSYILIDRVSNYIFANDINLSADNGRIFFTAILMFPFWNGFIGNALVRNPALANIRNSDGLTPLHVAAIHCQNNIIDILMDNGANPAATIQAPIGSHATEFNGMTVHTLLQSMPANLQIDRGDGTTIATPSPYHITLEYIERVYNITQ